MHKLFKNSVGASMLQVLVIGSALAGAGAYMLKNVQQQNKLVRTASTKGAYGVLKKELSEALADAETCKMTLRQGFENPIPTGMKEMPVSGMKTMMNGSPAETYTPGDEIYGAKIDSLKLMMPEGYVASDQMRMLSAEFAVIVKSAAQGANGSAAFGGETIALRIPLYLFMVNKKIMMCMSIDSTTILNALMDSCAKLGGRWVANEGVCYDLHGDAGKVNMEVADHFCSSNPSSCETHPYANLNCRNYKNPTPLVADKDNWVLRGFFADGTPDCACVPVKQCENPANYCKGTDLGTDWCYNDCGEGTKEDGECATCSSDGWKPNPSAVCENRTFTQTNGCGDFKNDVRGTKKESWSPSASTVCIGETFTQTSNCGSAPRTNVPGEKDCSCPTIARPKTWSEKIVDKTYDCTEGAPAGTTVLKNKESLKITTPADAENKGDAEYYCDKGTLVTVKEKCSPLPKTLDCSISYQYKSKNKVGLAARDGNWSKVKHGSENNCEGSGKNCGIRVGISCTGDAQVRISYQYKEFSTATPLQVTPWSTPDGTAQWGEWSQMNRKHDKEECAQGRYCGVLMKAETQGGGTCSVSYQHRWRKGVSPVNSDGNWSERTYSSKEDDGCSKKGCGIKATISCSI